MRLLRSFVFSSLHISIAACLWGVITFILLDVPINTSLLIVFFVTFLTHTFNRLAVSKEDRINYPERVKFALKYGKCLKIVSLIGYFIALIIALSYNIVVLVLTILPIAMLLLYPFLKKIILAKNIIVGFTWAITVILVSSSVGIFNMAVLSFFVFVFFRDFTNSIFFDIRDIEGDRYAGVKTFPVMFGVKKTIYFLSILNIISGILLGYFVFTNILPLFMLVLLALVFYDFIYFKLLDKKIDKFVLYDLIADSEIYFAAFVVILARLWL